MKKIFFALFAVASLFFVSCHDDIYGMIEKEVALEKAGINGDINSIVRYDNKLVLCSGRIYYKDATPSSVSGLENKQWKRIANPCTETGDNNVPEMVYFLASDDSNLYALSYRFYEDSNGTQRYTKSVVLWVTSSSLDSDITWTKVDISSVTAESTYEHVRLIMDNQAVGVGRNAYVKLRGDDDDAEWKLYELNGTSVGSEVTTHGAGEYAVSCVSFNGADYFNSGYSITANDTYMYYTKNGSEIYYADGYDETEKKFTNGAESEKKYSADKGKILSLAMAKNHILVGTTKGIARIHLDSNKIPDGTPGLAANGDSIISEYVYKVFVLDPTKEEGSDLTSGTDEYAASTIYGSIGSSSDSFETQGLWAYYPGRNEWNRDGTADTDSKGN